MVRRALVLNWIAGLLLLVVPNAYGSALVTDCDLLAAHPDDEQRADVPGVLFEEIEASRALPACQNALSEFPETPRFLFQLGRVVEILEGEEAAIDLYIRAAEAGSAQAALNLSIVYFDRFEETGAVDLETFDEGRSWQVYAADTLDSPRAQFLLSNSYRHAPTGRTNHELRIEYLLKSAEAGFHLAQHALGLEYIVGELVEQDIVLGVAWISRAAQQGDLDAQVQLAELALLGALTGTSADEALDLVSHLSEQGFPPADAYLGELLVEGDVLNQDIDKGFELLERAALQGDARAQEFLWRIYRPYYTMLMFSRGRTLSPEDMPPNTGPFYGKNSDDARRWAEVMSDYDYPDGLIVLAPLYEVGAGYEKSIETAFELYSRAAAQGHPVAIQKVETLSERYPELADQ